MKNIKVILLERINKLGNIGDVVNVNPGYARNFLIPKAKAKAATKKNIEYFQSKRIELEEKNTKVRLQAEQKKQTMQGLEVILVRASSDKGHLYGSVTARDIANACNIHNITKDQINIQNPIKTIGIFPIFVTLHPEVTVEIFVNIARSHEEAELQKKEQPSLQDQNNQVIDKNESKKS